MASLLEDGTIGAKLILGNSDRHRISENTYSWLWDYHVVAIVHNQDRKIFTYWRNAYQYYSTLLRGDFTYDSHSELK